MDFLNTLLDFFASKLPYILLGALMVIIYEGSKRGIKAGVKKLAQQGKPKLIGFTILALIITLIISFTIIGGI